MAKRIGRNEAQKEFVAKMDSLTGAHSRWEIWKDMIWMFATAISNSVDHRFREQREQQYLQIAKQYNERELQCFADMFGLMVITMQGAGDGFYTDFLGELFMELNLGNELGGQFFTPYHLCKMMSKICDDGEKQAEAIKRNGYIGIHDPACGAGATLIAAAEDLREKDINYQESCIFNGQDIDYTTALMCYIQLSLLGCAGYVHVGNTLSQPVTGHILFGDEGPDTWYTPMFFSVRWTTLRWLHNFKHITDSIFEKAEQIAEEVELDTENEPETAEMKDQAEEKVQLDPVPDEIPMFTVTSNKGQVAGQLSLF